MSHTNRNPLRPGVLEVFCGPMKCGKTRELINRVDKLHYLKQDFIFLKPSIDTRDPKIRSRFFGTDIAYNCEFIDPANPKEILDKIHEDHKLVVIDEAQFFDAHIVSIINTLLKRNINVVVGGLELDFRGEPFGAMSAILAIADDVYKMKAVCDVKGCHKLASRTQRLINNKPAPYDAPIISVEGEGIDELYEARCIEHHDVPNKP